VEGAVVQGLGWVTTEELVYNGKENYSPIAFQPIKCLTFTLFQNHRMPSAGNRGARYGNPKIEGRGEPPFMYGIGAYFAIQNAIKAFNPTYTPDFDAR
jgi:xanthine dehydrogenase large subunit